MEALYCNLLGVLWMFVYIQSVIACCDWAVHLRLTSHLISRKKFTSPQPVTASGGFGSMNMKRTGHGDSIAPYPFFYALKLVAKSLILADSNDVHVKTMILTGRPIAFQGPLLFFLMIYTRLLEFKIDTGVYIMEALGFGDGLAPIVGTYRYVPFGNYKSCFAGGGGADMKTISGSARLFVVTVIGLLFLRSVIGSPTKVYIGRIVGIALVASLEEAISGKWDNPAIACSVWIFLQSTTR